MAKTKKEKNIHVDKSDIVKESNTIARAQMKPPAESVWEGRIISQIVAFNRVADTEFPEAEFKLGRLFDGRKKISGRDFHEIEKAVIKLASTTYIVYRSREKFDVLPIFERISYDSGLISAKLNQALKPHYLQLKREFALYSLPEFRTLSSIYSQQLYRFLSSLRGLEDTTVPIERLHFITSAPESLKKDFRNFRLNVLSVAEKEINAKTSLKFSWEPIKQGRRVAKIRFVFGRIIDVETTVHELATKQQKLDEHAKWQRLSNACWERHQKAGVTCKPNNGNKCTFCRTRGRMAFLA